MPEASAEAVPTFSDWSGAAGVAVRADIVQNIGILANHYGA